MDKECVCPYRDGELSVGDFREEVLRRRRFVIMEFLFGRDAGGGAGLFGFVAHVRDVGVEAFFIECEGFLVPLHARFELRFRFALHGSIRTHSRGGDKIGFDLSHDGVVDILSGQERLRAGDGVGWGYGFL